MFVTRSNSLSMLGVLCVIGSLLGPSPASSALADDNSPDYWKPGYEKLAAMGRGYIVWESRRSGRWRIYRMELDGSNTRQISRDEPDRDHYCPHISPDGRRIAYLSYPKDHNTYEAFDKPFAEQAPLHLMSADGRFDRVIVPNARAYGEDRGVVWLNNQELVCIDSQYRTQRLNIETGEQSLLLNAPPTGELPALIDPLLQHAVSGSPTFCTYDRNARSTQAQAKQDGCQPYFSRDGIWGFWMGGAGGPINRVRLATGEASPILKVDDPRMPKDRNYLYFPMLSANARLFAFGASPDEHDHFTADYDIFVAPIDPKSLEFTGNPVRYTFDKGCDRFPDVYVEDSPPIANVHMPASPTRQHKPGAINSRNLHATLTGWPLSRDGLVFAWENGKRPNNAGPAGSERACTVSPRGRSRMNRYYAMDISQGAFTAETSSDALLNACRQTSRLTLEATITPDGLDAKGPARIISFSTSAYERDFTLGQEGSQLVFRLRTPATGVNGVNPEVSICTLQPKRPVHLIITYAPGELIAYCEGKQVFRTDKVQGDFSNWTAQHLLFGDEWNGERQWAGAVEGVAIYNRVLSPDEATKHAEAYRRLTAARKQSPKVEVEAVLARTSKIPTLKDIRPYKNALALFEYRIEKVVSGKLNVRTVRVARWVILNGETLPAAKENPGQNDALSLEPFDANPQLASQYLSDSLPSDWTAGTYFDTSNP